MKTAVIALLLSLAMGAHALRPRVRNAIAEVDASLQETNDRVQKVRPRWPGCTLRLHIPHP